MSMAFVREEKLKTEIKVKLATTLSTSRVGTSKEPEVKYVFVSVSLFLISTCGQAQSRNSVSD